MKIQIEFAMEEFLTPIIAGAIAAVIITITVCVYKCTSRSNELAAIKPTTLEAKP